MMRFLAVPLLLLVPSVARAVINPHFTPVHLVQEADLIFAGRLEATADAMTWKLTPVTIVKGKPSVVKVNLVECSKDHLEQVQQVFKENRELALIFADSKDPEKRGRLHVLGQWWGLVNSGTDSWKVVGPAPEMTGTFLGGTDMLLRMTQYIAGDADADVPISLGVKWASYVKVGNLPGEIAGMAAIELGKAGKPHLFVASAAGDKLFRPKGEEFEDATAASGLDTCSRRFAWMDVDGDGIADLVTWDSQKLGVRLADSDGRFKAAERFSLPLGECLGLAPCATIGRPGVLVSRSAGPLLLWADAKGWKKVDLPDGPQDVGPRSACIVADLDNDGFADVLQPGETGSTLWRGKAGGFEPPVRVKITTGGGAALAALGDFGQNGWLDVFLAGPEKNTLWENDGKANFHEVLRFGGSISYKCPPGASDVQVMDLNHDGRQDVCLTYRQADPLYHFNRGFRSFGEEGELRLRATQNTPNMPRLGQMAVAVADFNGAGSNDLAVLFVNGDLYCYFNDRTSMPGVRLRLDRGVSGPVTASCWIGEKFGNCVGTVSVPGHSPAAYLALRAPGECKIRYRLPGEAQQEKTVMVEDGPKEVILAAPAGK